jgi:hypothetical protein
MNNPLDPTLRALNACGCCAGTTAETPVTIDNRPGLDAIAFRVGTHPQFKATLLAALSAASRPALASLKTRENDDFTIALLDGWATVADVLAFYSERIANESYLRTATERRSVLELARAIGYELKPGVAAATWLAFTVEDAPGAPGYANIPAGMKVQSIPGPDEKPQVYETTKAILGRHEWNELHPVRTVLPAPYWGQRTLRLKGTTTNLKPGDGLLIVGDERAKDPGNENWDVRRVLKLEAFPNADPEAAFTMVTLDRALGTAVPFTQPARANAKVFALRLRASLFGHNAPDWRAMPDSVKAGFDAPQMESAFMPARTDWPGLTLAGISDGPPGTSVGTGLYGEYFDGTDFAVRKFFRTDAHVDFDWGANAPPGTGLGADNFSVRWTGWVEAKASGVHSFVTNSDDGVRLWVNGALVIDNWTDHPKTRDAGEVRLFAGRKYDLKLEYYEHTGAAVIQLAWAYSGQVEQVIPTSQLYPRDICTLHLDATYPSIVPGSWLVVSTPDYEEAYQVVTAAEDAKTNFTLSGKTTRLTIRGENLREQFNDRVRDATVFAQSEELERAPEPAVEPVAGDTITLENLVPELPLPRTLLVRGAAARVKVLRKGAPLELTLDSGATLPLSVGQRLTLLKPPTPAPSATVAARWDLQAADGRIGWVKATLEQLYFDPAPEGAELLLEAATLRLVGTTADGRTQLTLAQPLVRAYDPFTTTILANVAYATHGETVKDEILGSGDASQVNQQFTLRQKPLTYVPDTTPAGAASTLEMWVNDLKWAEAPTLYHRGPNERVYITRLADDGTVTVEFGDGRSGARLPTGQENLRAVYRKGIGNEGRVKAGQLSLLMTRPLGVKSVTNPQVPSEPANPQLLDDARRNAPRTVLTLDRVVSLQDYEDFARDFPGVAKARATWTWSEPTRGVLLSVLGADGRVLPEDGATVQRLIAALLDAGNPLVPVRAKSSPPVKFMLRAKVTAAADRDPEKVLAAVRGALQTQFAFAAREFGQSVALSEVIALIQNVPGVDSVDLDELRRPGVPAGPQPSPYLLAAKPANGIADSDAFAAELLILDETSLPDVEIAKP